jgi:hypothetical protein
LTKSRNSSGSTQTTTIEPKPLNIGLVQGGNLGFGHSKARADVDPDNFEVEDLTLMMLQAREGRA